MSSVRNRRARVALLVAPLLSVMSSLGYVRADECPPYVPYPYEMPVSEACPPIIECCPPSNTPMPSAPIEYNVTPLQSPSDATVTPEPTVAPEQAGLPKTVQVPESPLTDEAQIDDGTIDAAAPSFDLSQGLARNLGSGRGDSLAYADTPNMMGDFLGGGRNSLFNYNLAGDANPSFASGGSNATNTKLSDNNSAIPRDRVSMRYHYFNDSSSQMALRQKGDLEIGILDPTGTEFFVQDVGEGFKQEFDTHLIELAFERKITNNYSIEFRLPTVVSLDSNLTLNSTQIGQPFSTTSALYGISNFPGTEGQYDFELRDMSIINKFALIRSRSRIVSGGFGLRLPTGQDSSLAILDGINTDPVNEVVNIDRNGNGTFDGVPPDIVLPLITAFRQRDVQIDLQTVSITPFLASTGTLGRRSFYNAFTSLDVPVGKNEITYQETYLDTVLGPGFVGGDQPDDVANGRYSVFANPAQQAKIREQVLLNMDISIGRWLYEAKNRSARLRRLAVIGELHYSTTLNDADTAEFQSFQPDGSTNTQTGQLFPNGSDITNADFAGPVDESPFVVGNSSNRFDVLNANFGVVTQWGNSCTLSTGVGVPLRDDDDALFDWEFQLQLNYYFGGIGSGLPPMF